MTCYRFDDNNLFVFIFVIWNFMRKSAVLFRTRHTVYVFPLELPLILVNSTYIYKLLFRNAGIVISPNII